MAQARNQHQYEYVMRLRNDHPWLSVGQLHEKLSVEFADEFVTEKTVGRWIAGSRSAPGSLWSLVNGTPAKEILEVLGTIIERSQGRQTDIDDDTARWVETIRSSVSDIPAWPAYVIAQCYSTRAKEKRPTYDLGALLAIAPWRGEQRVELLSQALKHGLPRPPFEVILALGLWQALDDSGRIARLAELKNRGRDLQHLHDNGGAQQQ